MKKGLIGTLAQIALIVLLLPFIAIMMGICFSDLNTFKNFISSLVDNIPLFEVWVSIFYQLGTNMAAGTVVESTLFVYIGSFFEAMIIGITVHICNRIGKALKFSGLPILTTFVGVFLGCVVLKITSSLGGNFGTVIADIGVIVVMLIGIKIMFKSLFPSVGIFSLKKILLLFIESILAVIMCGYLTGLTLVASGNIESIGIAIATITSITILTIIALVIVYFVSNAEEYI